MDQAVTSVEPVFRRVFGGFFSLLLFLIKWSIIIAIIGLLYHLFHNHVLSKVTAIET